MSQLEFDSAGVKRLIAHAKAAPDHSLLYGEKKKSAALTLVKDSGIYLMSNGVPRDIIDPATNLAFVVYAKGFAPKDEDSYERCREAVGGDDFCERVPFDDGLEQMLERPNAVALVIGLTPRKMTVFVIERPAIKRKR